MRIVGCGWAGVEEDAVEGNFSSGGSSSDVGSKGASDSSERVGGGSERGVVEGGKGWKARDSGGSMLVNSADPPRVDSGGSMLVDSGESMLVDSADPPRVDMNGRRAARSCDTKRSCETIRREGRDRVREEGGKRTAMGRSKGTRTHPDERIDRMLVLELLFWRLGGVALQPNHDDLCARRQHSPNQCEDKHSPPGLPTAPAMPPAIAPARTSVPGPESFVAPSQPLHSSYAQNRHTE